MAELKPKRQGNYHHNGNPKHGTEGRVNDMRLIDADAAKEWFKGGRFYMFSDDVLNRIAHTPTIDAVPVVRCRECKHNNSPDCPMVYEEYFFDEDDGGDTYVIDKAVDPEGFCSYGERRDGEGDG